MPGRTTLKSVAHNVGHSFFSLMNYVEDDYVFGHLIRAAITSGEDTLRVDLLRRSAEPAALASPSVSVVLGRYYEHFAGMVAREGSDMTFVRSAVMVVRFDLSRAGFNGAGYPEAPFRWVVEIDDDRGRRWRAEGSRIDWSERSLS